MWDNILSLLNITYFVIFLRNTVYVNAGSSLGDTLLSLPGISSYSNTSYDYNNEINYRNTSETTTDELNATESLINEYLKISVDSQKYNLKLNNKLLNSTEYDFDVLTNIYNNTVIESASPSNETGITTPNTVNESIYGDNSVLNNLTNISIYNQTLHDKNITIDDILTTITSILYLNESISNISHTDGEIFTLPTNTVNTFLSTIEFLNTTDDVTTEFNSQFIKNNSSSFYYTITSEGSEPINNSEAVTSNPSNVKDTELLNLTTLNQIKNVHFQNEKTLTQKVLLFTVIGLSVMCSILCIIVIMTCCFYCDLRDDNKILDTQLRQTCVEGLDAGSEQVSKTTIPRHCSTLDQQRHEEEQTESNEGVVNINIDLKTEKEGVVK